MTDATLYHKRDRIKTLNLPLVCVGWTKAGPTAHYNLHEVSINMASVTIY